MSEPYCSREQVKARLASDNVNMSSAWDGVLDAVIVEVTAELDREVRRARNQPPGWSFVADTEPSERRFSAKYVGRYLPLDDCVEVTAVYSATTPLVAGVDYISQPLNGTPITGLQLVRGSWDATPGGNRVVARWGFAETLPADVRAAAITESIRAYRGAGVGYDDRVGMTPFGTVVTLPAFTTRTLRLVLNYARAVVA